MKRYLIILLSVAAVISSCVKEVTAVADKKQEDKALAADPCLIPGEIIVEFTEEFTLQVEKDFDIVVEGMAMAATGGTARGAIIDSIVICGKTGTAENPHGADHSIFMAFAPKDNPRIVIAIYIENGGFGAQYAVPIGGLIMEKYLKGEISPRKKPIEERMMNSNLIEPVALTQELRLNTGETKVVKN